MNLQRHVYNVYCKKKTTVPQLQIRQIYVAFQHIIDISIATVMNDELARTFGHIGT